MGLAAKRLQWVPKKAHLLAVPLHEKRLHRRGYNQAELLVEGAARHLFRPRLPLGTVIRKSDTAVSNKLGPPARRANLKGVFQVAKPATVAGKVLCVIDDIYTTGATLDEMARTLLYAGAAEVYALTFAIAVTENFPDESGSDSLMLCHKQEGGQ